jgi:hypothetical protein
MTGQRVLRLNGKTKVAPPTEKELPLRTAEKVLEELEASSVKDVSESCREAELQEIVEKAALWDAQRKDLEKKVKQAKELMLHNAKEGKWKSKPGTERAVCNIGASTSTSLGTTTEFARILKRENKMHLFDDLTKIAWGPAQKYLGIDAMEGFYTKDTEEYGSVTFKLL